MSRSVEQLLAHLRDERFSGDQRWRQLAEVEDALRQLGRERSALALSLGLSRGKGGGWKCPCGYSTPDIFRMADHARRAHD